MSGEVTSKISLFKYTWDAFIKQRRRCKIELKKTRVNTWGRAEMMLYGGHKIIGARL